MNLSLFDAPLYRRSDPETSYQAAEHAKQFKARDISIIWAALKEHGRMTPREIAEVSGLDYVAVQRRGAEMERKKLIVRGPEIRDGMRVWEAA